MPRLNRGRKPPSSDGSGMWEFPVAPKVMLRAMTEEALKQQIFEWRLRNGQPVGDIEKEIEAYYCKTWPNACNEEPADRNPNAAPLPPHETMATRIARWAAMVAHAMPRGGFSLSDKDAAEARASACHGCPKNVSWRGGCSSCTQSTNAVLLSLRQMKKTTRDGNLLGCLVLGSDNQTSVWLPETVTQVSDDQNLQLPDRCWLKRK